MRALAVSGTSIFAGGDFGLISGLRRDNLAQLDALTGRLSTFSHTVSGAPYALSVGNGRLYAAGSFSAVDGNRRGNLAAFSLVTGGLDSGWRPSADDAVHAITAYGSKVYVGGAFHKVNGVSGTLRIAAVSGTGGSVDRGFLPRSPAQVNAIAVDGAGVYVATGGQGGRAIAYSSGGALRWQRLFDGDAAAIATLNGVTYVGGHFDRACLTLSNGVHGTCTDGLGAAGETRRDQRHRQPDHVGAAGQRRDRRAGADDRPRPGRGRGGRRFHRGGTVRAASGTRPSADPATHSPLTGRCAG